MQQLIKSSESKVDQYNNYFISMRYWLLSKSYYTALAALEYASKFHTGKRKDGLTNEYFHQLSIAHYVKSIATSLKAAEETFAAVFLHDVCEDYGVAMEEIELQFGSIVREAVWLLTKKFRGQQKSPEDYYLDVSTNKIASIVKGADRIHNIQSMIGVFTAEKQIAYIQETQDYILRG